MSHIQRKEKPPLQPLPPLQPGRLLRLPVVLQYLGGIGKSSLYLGIRKGLYPSPLKLGPRTSVWKSDALIPLIEQGVQR